MKIRWHVFQDLIIVFLMLQLFGCAGSRLRIDKTPVKTYFEQNEVFGESHTGLLVFSPESKETIFDFNGSKHFIPASNTKLLTYYAAKKYLEDSLVALEYCRVGDSLIFRGTGAPTLLYSGFEFDSTLTFLEKNGPVLYYFPRPMADRRFGPGWSWDDYPYYYSAEKSVFPIYGNLVRFMKDSASSDVQIIPNAFATKTSIQQASGEDALLTRKEFANLFEWRLDTMKIDYADEVPFIYSSDLFVSLLGDSLQRPVYLIDDFSNCEVKQYKSVPTDSVLKNILMVSDNFLAEQILLNISSALGDTLSSEKTIEMLMDNDFENLKEELQWVDGSGLSRYNLMSPKGLVGVLQKIYETVSEQEIEMFFPEAGNSGTLENRFTTLDGYIFAKTGSMTHVYNLSGFIKTKSGKTLLFSFMNNNFNVTFSDLRSEMEKVLSVFVNDIK